MKKILITGENSYIGTSFKKWIESYPEAYQVESISVRLDNWKEKDFSKYDVVFHVAGIAHVSRNPKMAEKYYQINRDLTIQIAEKSKKEGVSQFIFMSSIIVYGESTDTKQTITKETIPTPSNFYGDSKLQAEEGISILESSTFKVVVIRPPMIYGENSKGNYPKLAKLAKIIPLFPDIKNERSMLHIDNLCEFIKIMIDYEESGLFFPQNKEYVNTSELVQEIGRVYGNKILLVKYFNPIILFFFKVSIINKVFGNLIYDEEMSRYGSNLYQVRTLKESIYLTERGKK